MIMYVLLLAVILGCTAQNFFKKEFGRRNGNGGSLLFSGLISLVSAIFFLVLSGFKLDIPVSLLPYSIAFATVYSLATLFGYLALMCGPLSMSSIVGNFSMLVPILFGIIFKGEPVTLFFLIGFAFLVLSILFINSGEGNVKISFKWAVLSVISLVANGFCSVVQSVQQEAFAGGYKNEMMTLALFISAIFFFVVSWIKEREEIKDAAKNGWLYASLAGAANGAVNLFVMILMGLMNISLIYPLISAGGILCGILMAVIIYKERLSKKQYLVVLFGVISVVLMQL